ncbi:MAG: LytTR family transcriptional regulator [Oscillospiraceae bacterium]|nr:LytTR family transcriptional regulator [Oscillospiraceae bacterium]
MKFTLIVDPNQEEQVVATVHHPSELTAKIEELVLQHSGDNALPVYAQEDLVYLPFSEIECITVVEGKTYAIDTKGEHNRVRLRLYEVEQLLPNGFIRINKSSLANQSRLERFAASYSGAVDAVFKCGYREYVSRRCFAEIKRRFVQK